MILLIDCCPREESRTRRLAQALLRKLGDYETVSVYAADMKPLNRESLNRRNELLKQGKLDAEEFALARQFAAADTIVIAAPYWDLSFPSALKIYIENIYITGIVSVYSPEGVPVGLCRARSLYYVTTSGGPYDPRYSFEYLRTLGRDYFGIPEAVLIKAEMLDIDGNDPEKILQEAIGGLQIDTAAGSQCSESAWITERKEE